MTFADFKNQLNENRSKAAVLGVLTLVMLLAFGRLFVGGPQPISAAGLNRPIAAVSTSTILADDNASPAADNGKDDAQKKIQESKDLWAVLKEKRGLAPAEAFLFDPSYYSLDPNSATAKARLNTRTEDLPSVTKADDLDAAQRAAKAQRAAMVAQVREEARGLVLQSTVLSNPPTAVLNSGIFRVNDRVGGFRIVAINARQVLVEKDGVTLAVEMAN